MTAPIKSAVCSVPRCTIVTGPSGKEKIRWIQETIQLARADHLTDSCAVLATLEIAPEMERFARSVPRVSVRRLTVPCLCCPAAAALPGQVRLLMEAREADWVLIDLPALAAPGLLAEFDAPLRWPREFVVCLNPDWTKAHQADALSFFQFGLISSADRVIDAPEPCVPAERRAEARRNLARI